MTTTDQTTDVRSRAADIIEPHIDGSFRRRDRAVGNADDLWQAGLLRGSTPTRGTGSVRDQAANLLQCRHPWQTAERIAAELDEAGLLAGEQA